MSLIKQIWALLAAVILLAFAGSLAVNVVSARAYLITQLGFKNNDSAQMLALTLAQHKGDTTLMELAIASQFDTGFYERIRLVATDGKALVDKQAARSQGAAPAWFASALRIEPDKGVAQVSDGWRAIGSLEVTSQTGYAVDELWWATLGNAGMLAALGLGAALLASWGMRTIRRPLDQVVAQAHAIGERRFVMIDEPRPPELRRVAIALNTMVARLRAVFDEQAEQVQHLQREANCDALTGLANRRQSMDRLAAMLGREDGPANGVIVLLRVADLGELNRRLGHRTVDDRLKDIANVLAEQIHAHPSAIAGRLNGSDFVLVLPDEVSASTRVARLLEALRATLPFDLRVVASGAVWHHGMSLSAVMASVDVLLARAEAEGGQASDDTQAAGQATGGEDAWRQRIAAALQGGRAHLGRFRVVDREGRLIHLESPMRLVLEAGGTPSPAAQWLPMARRTGQIGEVDLVAARLALEAIAQDGQPRGVNLAPASLLRSDFIPRLRELVAAHPEAAPKLSVEVAEQAAVSYRELVRELCAQLRAHRVHVGLEHAGQHLANLGDLIAAGLDYVKLDAAIVAGVRADAARAEFVAGTVRMLSALGVPVYAEGVADEALAQSLWACGVDGITGPAVHD